MPLDEPEVTPHESALHDALRELHRRAGEPSSRAIADNIDNISHSTVNSALRGPRIPSWPILSKIVTSLGGDEDVFRELWTNAKDSGAKALALPAPASNATAEVSVFISYARVDDDATYGRISKIVDDIATTYRSMTGRTVGIFKDTDAIKPGENWKDRIRLGLSDSSIFVAFLSPAYLRSPMCRQELSEFTSFLTANSESRLILPLVFADHVRIDRQFEEDELWQSVSVQNRLNIYPLRSLDPGTSTWIELVEAIADRIDEVLSSDEVSRTMTENPRPRPHETNQQESSGTLEKLAGLEQSAPQFTLDIERAGRLLEAFGVTVNDTAPIMNKAKTFGTKLAVSKRLADELQPIAEDLDEAVDAMSNGFEAWSEGISAATSMIRRAPAQAKDSEVQDFLKAVRNMAVSGEVSLGSLANLHDSLAEAMGYSASLDKPLKKMRAIALRLAEFRGTFQNWIDDLDALDSALAVDM